MSTLQETKLVKICKTCKEEKPIFEFTKDKNEKDGINKYCRVCTNERTIRTKQSIAQNSNAMRMQLLSLSNSRVALLKSLLNTDTPKKNLEEAVSSLPEASKKRICSFILNEINRLIDITEDKLLKK
jgi:hypothetical protein